MTFRTLRQHITRNGLATLAVVAAGGLAAPVALADPPSAHRAPPSDAVDRYLANDRAHARQPAPTPDLVERWVASGRGQADLIERSVEIRRPVGFPDGRPDGYQPQVRGTGTEAVAVSRTSADGFAWGDAAVGAAFGLALALIAGAARGRLAHP